MDLTVADLMVATVADLIFEGVPLLRLVNLTFLEVCSE